MFTTQGKPSIYRTPLPMQKLFALMLFAALLYGCSDVPTRPEAMAPDHQAAQAMAFGDYGRAHALYQRLASEHTPPESWHYIYQSSLALYRLDLLAQAAQQLEALPEQELPAALQMERQLLLGQIYLKRDPGQALEVLHRPAVDDSTLPSRTDLYAEYHRLRALALGRLDYHLESAHEHILREMFLSDVQDIDDNQQAIWQALAQLPPQTLQQFDYRPPHDALSGWVELAALARNYRLDPAELGGLIARWQQRYPGHPASAEFLRSLLQRSKDLTIRPNTIAVLLPLSGRLAAPGQAIQDGMLAAWYADPQRHTIRLRFIDVGNVSSHSLGHYYQAVAEGAEFIIGPLDKDAVETLARQVDLPVPTLALNYAMSPNNDNLYQFALSPEDEARDAAERAWQMGYQQAATLIPATPLGERLHRAFVAHWQELGGVIVSSRQYAPDQSDYAGPLKGLLNIQDSELRHSRINRLSNRRVEFLPRRRQDIDFIFLAAQPRQARLIRPQLAFHHAGDLPVLATSHLYGGQPDPNFDRDMNGILFCDTPWTLNAETTTSALRRQNHDLLSQYPGDLQRLVAMGVDAYQLVPLLPMLKSQPYESYTGETGRLSADSLGQISRKLQWARFVRGQPQLLQEEDRKESSDVRPFTP